MVGMLPLSQIFALRETVDQEWRSPVADAVGECWGLPAGALRFWRSSAAHVFVAPPGADSRGVLYARFAPAEDPAGSRLAEGVRFHARLAAAGASVARVVPSRTNRMVERVGTPLGDMYASVLGKVDGDELDVEELDGGAAAAWGAALGAFHQAAGLPAMRAQTQRSDPFAALASARAALEDPELAVAARTLSTVLTASPATPLVFGHGDFELDNLRWTDGWPTCFDLDESGAMPAAADVASAARDLLGPLPGSPEHPELLTAFLQGYQRTSGQTIEPQELVLPRAAFAAQQLLQATEVLDIRSPSVAWLKELDGSLRTHYQIQHDLLLMTADVLV